MIWTSLCGSGLRESFFRHTVLRWRSACPVPASQQCWPGLLFIFLTGSRCWACTITIFESLHFFPLLLIGCERIFRKKRPGLFIFMVFLTAVSNFYFFIYDGADNGTVRSLEILQDSWDKKVISCFCRGDYLSAGWSYGVAVNLFSVPVFCSEVFAGSKSVGWKEHSSVVVSEMVSVFSRDERARWFMEKSWKAIKTIAKWK